MNKRCEANNTITCICKDGYRMDLLERCDDWDECAKPDDNECDENSACVNSEGGYNCTCNEGYYGTGKSCSPGDCDGAKDCAENEECVSPRSNQCRCKKGYKRDEDGKCIDIDECSAEVQETFPKKYRCHAQSKCINNGGSYKCLCNEGFYGTGTFCTRGQCYDDQCQDYNEKCKSKVELDCICKDGFVRDANDKCVSV